MVIPRLIGMIHLGPLPGSPGFAGSLESVIERATADAVTLTASGFDGLMIENFGDAPFFADDVPKVTIAAMTAAVRAIGEVSPLPMAVNVLRNDAVAALAIAAATDAFAIRVNVLAGTMFTDQGVVHGRSAVVARRRAEWCPDVRVLADVMVKHAVPPAGLTLEMAVDDTVERSGADAIVVSGQATGSPVDERDLAAVRSRAGSLPVIIGSGADPASIAGLLRIANAAICGTAIKVDGVTTNPVDPARAGAMVAAAG